MSKKVIDVSSYQGVIDWSKAKKDGVDGAVLKIIRKDLSPDTQFENNWSGCEAAGVPIVGVYNYTYATTVSKAKSDAQKVIDILAGRKAKVWLDVEDSSLTGLDHTLIDLILAYQKVITGAGLDFGAYTGLSFYNTYLALYASEIDCHFWIARYPVSSQMALSATPDTDKQPAVKHTLEGWQYSSNGSVSGISGPVDLDMWYGDIMATPDPAETGYNPYPIPERILKYNASHYMAGEDVQWVQWHLVRLGFLDETTTGGATNVDGSYGPRTTQAVKDAQSHYGILVDGIVGTQTRYVLRYS